MRGKVVGSLFAVIFLGIGGVFLWALVGDVRRTVAARSWDEAVCTVVESGVELPEGDEDFRFAVSYRYRIGSRDFTGERYRFGYLGSDDSAAAYRLVERFPVAARVPCWVDPGDPRDAILAHRSLAHAGWLVVPMAILLFGGALLYWTWRPARSARETGPSGAAAGSPLATAGERFTSGNPGCLVAFFGVFLAAGLLILWLTFFGPMLGVLAARGWSAADCEVVHSRVQTHSGDESDTYSVDILFRYRWDGREYHADRYDFLSGSTSGYEGKAKIVEQYPAGHRFTCWVDPDDPAEAVIDRGLSARFLVALFGLPFALVGAGGIFWSVSKGKKSAKRPARGKGAEGGTQRQPEPVPAGRRELKPKFGPVGKIFGILFVAAFWNGITGVFVWQVIAGWRSGSPDGCLTVFILPFVAIGLLLLWAVPYTILSLFNPRPHLTVEPAVLTLGEPATLTWGFAGAARRIRTLRLKLVARRKETTRSGGETRTKTEDLHSLDLLETDDRVQIPHGSVEVIVPPEMEPTSDRAKVKVTWAVKIEGKIRWWPDVGEEMEVEVRPGWPEGEAGEESGEEAEDSLGEGPPIPPPPDDWVPPPAEV